VREPDLRIVTSAGLAGLASPISASPDVAEAALREHDAITRRIHDRVASLPARYGQVFEDADAIARALVSQSSALASGLARVGDRVEVAVTLRWRTPRDAVQPDSAESGRAYLEQRASVERVAREAESIVARLAAELPCEQAFLRHTTCPRPGVAAIVALLIDRDELAAAQERVMSFGERSADVTAAVDGVFAPYSFAS
jgi:hypothetical protein